MDMDNCGDCWEEGAIRGLNSNGKKTIMKNKSKQNKTRKVLGSFLIIAYLSRGKHQRESGEL